MTKSDIVASKIRSVIEQIDSLPPDSGVTSEHLNFVRDTLLVYLKKVENDHESITFTDANRVSRLVIEYWPMSLPAGEAVIAAEQAVRKLVEK
jgi:hypothetical protein